VWGILLLGSAAFGVWSLRRRAGAAGIALSADALEARQTHVLRPVPFSDGWRERVREGLVASERAFLVAGKGDEEIHFRWRPGRGEQSVWGSMSFDAPSGDAVLDVRDGGTPRGGRTRQGILVRRGVPDSRGHRAGARDYPCVNGCGRCRRLLGLRSGFRQGPLGPGGPSADLRAAQSVRNGAVSRAG
jgi:hypothetical protein